MIGAFVSKGALERKPRYGDPCTGCGICCIMTLCPLAQAIYRYKEGPCPALEWVDGKSACGMVTHPERHASTLALIAVGRAELSATAKFVIGAGDGCDCHLVNEPPRSAEVVARWTEQASRDRARTKRAWNTWGFTW